MNSHRPYVALRVLAPALLLAASLACASSPKPVAAPAPPPAAAPAPVATRPPAPAPLVGHITREALRAYVPWQASFAAPYAPDASAAAAIKARAGGVSVLLIVGTWCPDSRREVPRFFAIMDGAGIADSQLTMVGVDRTKKDAEGLTERWGVTRVPTFIFLRDGREVGRVVERTPAGATLEGEIARVLAEKS